MNNSLWTPSSVLASFPTVIYPQLTALTVANICSGNGTCIRHDISLLHVVPSPSKWIWQCEQPSAKDWAIWLQALQLAFGPQLIIAILLGGWL